MTGDDDTPKTSDVWDTEGRKNAGRRFALLDSVAEFVETFEGLAQGLIRNGWTDAQARAIVAYQFGWRPVDGSTPDGAERGGFT